MTSNIKQFPKVKRPGEYFAFFTLETQTKAGTAYVFLACDALSGFCINTGIELNENPENILKHIYLLTENPDFVRHMDKGFTLVLDQYEELNERINEILKHVNGKILFDKKFHHHIADPMKKSFSELLNKS